MTFEVRLPAPASIDTAYWFDADDAPVVQTALGGLRLVDAVVTDFGDGTPPLVKVRGHVLRSDGERDRRYGRPVVAEQSKVTAAILVAHAGGVGNLGGVRVEMCQELPGSSPLAGVFSGFDELLTPHIAALLAPRPGYMGVERLVAHIEGGGTVTWGLLEAGPATDPEALSPSA